jgi:hypothetical protein
MEQSEPGYVRVETASIGVPDGMPPPRPVRGPPPLDQAAALRTWMAPELLEAWKIIARDLETPDAIIPLVLPNDWDEQESYACAMVSWQDGSGAGISVPRHEPLADRVVHWPISSRRARSRRSGSRAARRCGRTAPGIRIPTR